MISYFQDNVVPVLFLSMLVIQFFFIVLDRGLYLRKNYVGKIIFQYFLIFGLHVWMFFVLPATTVRHFLLSPLLQLTKFQLHSRIAALMQPLRLSSTT